MRIRLRILDRYLLACLLPPFIFCFSAFAMLTVIYHLFDHFSEILKARPPFAMIVRYYVGMLLPALEYLLPASLLFATLYAIWNLTRNNEIIAMRASGISQRRIMLPFLATGLFLTVASMILTETATPDATYWSDQFNANKYRIKELKIDLPYYYLRGRRLWYIPSFNTATPAKLTNGVEVTQERDDGTPSIKITADRAEWLDGEWWFYAVTEKPFDKDGNPITVADDKQDKPAYRLMTALSERPSDLLSEAKLCAINVDMSQAWQYMNYREMRRYVRTHKGISQEAIAQMRFALDRRIAVPWACLVVSLFGIPAGIRGSRQNMLAGIFLALGLFGAFYALGWIGALLGMKHIIWTWLGAWLSNIVFFAAGAVMLGRMK